MLGLLAAALAFAAPAGAQTPFSPSAYLDFERTPQAIAIHCRASKEKAAAALKDLAGLPAESRTFENTPWALDNALWALSDATVSDVFPKDVSTSSAARQAGSECATLLAKFGVEVFTREDLFKALKAYEARKEALKGEDAKLLEKELLDFKRSGLMLTPEKRQELKGIRQRIVELQQAYEKNLGEVKDFLLVTKAELEGLPEDYVKSREKEGDRYKISLDYPDYFPFMQNAKDPGARKKLEALFNNRAAKENLPLFKEALNLRNAAAHLLGYPNHAAYVLEERMAKKPETVDAFVERLEKKLKVLADKELEVLLALKKKQEGGKSDGLLHVYDWRYYDTLLRKTKYDLDQEKIKEYFPMDVVTSGMMEVYQKLFNVRFREVAGALAWHPDVKLYEITDASGGAAIGYFYMDLFPREGKYKHAAAFDLVKARLLSDGSYQRPVSAIVANFNKPTPERPSLLKHGEHEEVETYFHEFGHIMHQTLSRAKHGRFAGSSTAQDFVEAPSQMLENWVWDPEVLRSLSGHYQDRSKKLPAELLKKMIAAKNVDSGLVNLRQLFFAAVDMRYHEGPVEDTTAVYGELQRKVSLIPISPGTHPEASFGHLMGGYDSAYYGYMWSKVYAEDMFSVFETKGVLNPEVGLRYRREVLEKGSSRDEMDSLKSFLGREPNEEAFLKSIGLAPKRS